MKHLALVFPLLCALQLLAQKEPPLDSLFKKCLDEEPEGSTSLFPTCWYVNRNGDTVIPPGKYAGFLGDDFVYFTPVFLKQPDCEQGQCGPYAVTREGTILFRYYWFDNGPDYFSDGLVRVVENGLIGYADETGKIVIRPQFTCATPFENGKARVAYACKTVPIDEEYSRWESDAWYTVNKKGRVKRMNKPGNK